MTPENDHVADSLAGPLPELASEEVLERLKKASGVKSDTELGAILGISQASVSKARRKERIPPDWVITIGYKFGVSTDWLLWGTGPQRVGESGRPGKTPGFELTSEVLDNIPDMLGLDESQTEAAREDMRRFKKYLHDKGWIEPGTVPVLNLGDSDATGWRQIKETSLRAKAPSDIASSPGSYAVIAAGDDLVQAGIEPGFLLFCDPNIEPRPGDLVFVLRQGSLAVIKRSEDLAGEPAESSQAAVVVYVKRRL